MLCWTSPLLPLYSRPIFKSQIRVLYVIIYDSQYRRFRNTTAFSPAQGVWLYFGWSGEVEQKASVTFTLVDVVKLCLWLWNLTSDSPHSLLSKVVLVVNLKFTSEGGDALFNRTSAMWQHMILITIYNIYGVLYQSGCQEGCKLLYKYWRDIVLPLVFKKYIVWTS